VFVSFHFSLCICCFVLVLTSMHHESLVEVLKKERVASILPVYCEILKKRKKKGFVYCNSRLGEKGVVQSENRGCPLEWSRPGEKRVALSENLECLLE